MKETLIKFPTMFVDSMLVPCIREDYPVVAKLSIIDVWNQQRQENDNMINARQDFKNI